MAHPGSFIDHYKKKLLNVKNERNQWLKEKWDHVMSLSAYFHHQLMKMTLHVAFAIQYSINNI